MGNLENGWRSREWRRPQTKAKGSCLPTWEASGIKSDQATAFPRSRAQQEVRHELGKAGLRVSAPMESLVSDPLQIPPWGKVLKTHLMLFSMRKHFWNGTFIGRIFLSSLFGA